MNRLIEVEAHKASMNTPIINLELVERAFPFYLWLDRDLFVRAAGASLQKALPALKPGHALHDLFAVRRPLDSSSLEAWKRHGHELCALTARGNSSLRLRGNPEFLSDGSVFLVITPVITSLDQLSDLGLGLNDFAKHDAAGDMLLLARASQMAAADTSVLAERLKGRSNELALILELSHSGVLAFHSDGHLQHANGAVLDMLILTRQQAVKMSSRQFCDYLATLLDPSFPPPDWSEVTVRESYVTLHMAVPRPAIIQVHSRPDTNGGWISYWRDTTAESEVDRMKTEFLSTAAHELRTPMVSIYGFTELLLSREIAAPKRQEVLSTIHRQAHLMIKMVNELLDLARIEARQGKDLCRLPVEIGSLVDQCMRGLQGSPGAHRLRYAARDDAVKLLLDADKTSQALSNVLSNALKYSSESSVVDIRVVHRDSQRGPEVGIEVVDHGIGMSPEQVARVFERFYRADPSGSVPGTGLGMSLVKEIVQLQGGTVELHSKAGQGTTVTLWFPSANLIQGEHP